MWISLRVDDPDCIDEVRHVLEGCLESRCGSHDSAAPVEVSVETNCVWLLNELQKLKLPTQQADNVIGEVEAHFRGPMRRKRPKTRTRKNFLQDVAYATAVATVLGVTAPQRPWGLLPAQAQELNSVRAYGARGDGVADDTQALQDAINATYEFERGPLYVDPGTYNITRKLFVRNGVEIYGAGSRSLIRNVRRTRIIPTDVGVFSVGNYISKDDGHSFQNETWYGFHPEPTGTRTLRFKEPGTAAAFFIGDAVALRSAETDTKYTSHKVYLRAEINEVTAVNRTDGRVTLKYGLSESFQGFSPQIARCEGKQKDAFGEPVRVIKRATVRDMKLQTELDVSKTATCFSYGGCFECKFLRIEVPRCTSFLSMNGVSRSLVDLEGRRVYAGRKLFDVAYFSHNSVLRNVQHYRLQNTYYEYTALLHGEGAHDCTFDNVNVRMGLTSPMNPELGKEARRGAFFSSFRRSKYLNSSVQAQYVPYDALGIDGTSDINQSGGRFEGLHVVCGTRALTGISLRASGKGGYCTVRNCDVDGSPRDEQIVLRPGTHHSTVRDNKARVRNSSGNASNTLTANVPE